MNSSLKICFDVLVVFTVNDNIASSCSSTIGSNSVGLYRGCSYLPFITEVQFFSSFYF